MRAARTIPRRLRHRRHDGLRHAAERLPLRLAAARTGAALLLHRQRKAAAIRHRGRAAASLEPVAERRNALWLERCRHRAGRRWRAGDDCRAQQRSAAARCGRTMWSAATAAARWCARPPASRRPLTDHDRLMVLLVFRSTGLHRLLERFPDKSFYNVLHPDLKGYWQVLRPRRSRHDLVLPRAGAAGTTKDNFDFRGYLHEAVGDEFDVEFEHIGFWDLRIAIADQYRIGTRLHRRRCRAQPSALWRLRHQHRPRRRRQSRLEAGRGAARLGRQRICWIPTARSGARCSHRPRGISSRRRSKATGSS